MVCTRNRWRSLDACLGSLGAQDGPETFEVVVVDNASSDATKAVVSRWARHAPTVVRLLDEPRTGLSHARNTGLAASSAPLVAFVDDDARPAPGWVTALIDGYRRVPEAVAVGGPVTLAWPSGRPGWVSPALESWYSAVDLGPERRLLEPEDQLFGTNLSVRRQVAVEVGGFDPRLGRMDRRLRSGEELDLLDRLRPFGPVVYEPGAAVEHHVLPDRLSRRWLLRRTYAGGRTRAALDCRVETTRHWKNSLRSAGVCVREATGGLNRTARRIEMATDREAALMEDLVLRSVELGAARELVGLGVRRALRSDGAERHE